MTAPAARPLLPWRAYAAVLLAAVLAAYAADVGRAFIKEDATWILASRIQRPADLLRVYTETGGFFRPTVALSFAVNHWMFGGHPAGYGWTNLLLAVACAAALFRLSRILGLSAGAGLLAAGLWILSFHGINMAVLWLSGRTALLLTLFALLAAAAAAVNRLVLMSVFAFLAMTSKEEGVLLPIVLLAILWLRPIGPPPKRQAIAAVAALLAVWAVYAMLRMQSDAYTPMSAPAFYTFTLAPGVVARNIGEYADRALTLPVAVSLLALAVVRRRPALVRRELKVAAIAGVWFAAAFALTVLLPGRSSLYALFPSAAAALAAGLVLDALWRTTPPSRRRALALLALALPVVLVPVHWQRNRRWTELADISRQTVRTLEGQVPSSATLWKIVVQDDHSTRANVAAALGWGLPDTMQLVTGRRPRAWFVPPPPDMHRNEWGSTPETADVLLVLRNGRITRETFDGSKPATAGQIW